MLFEIVEQLITYIYMLDDLRFLNFTLVQINQRYILVKKNKALPRGLLAIIIPHPAQVIEISQAASFPELSHSVSQQWSTYLAQFPMYITDIKVNDGRK